jgi:hypothetical protein
MWVCHLEERETNSWILRRFWRVGILYT